MGDATPGDGAGEADTMSEVGSMLRERRTVDSPERAIRDDEDDGSDEEEAFTRSLGLRALAADRHEWGT